jgi:hypothetical protein
LYHPFLPKIKEACNPLNFNSSIKESLSPVARGTAKVASWKIRPAAMAQDPASGNECSVALHTGFRIE